MKDNIRKIINKIFFLIRRTKSIKIHLLKYHHNKKKIRILLVKSKIFRIIQIKSLHNKIKFLNYKFLK